VVGATDAAVPHIIPSSACLERVNVDCKGDTERKSSFSELANDRKPPTDVSPVLAPVGRDRLLSTSSGECPKDILTSALKPGIER